MRGAVFTVVFRDSVDARWFVQHLTDKGLIAKTGYWGDSAEWVLDLNARAPRTPAEQVMELRHASEGQIAIVAHSDEEVSPFGVVASVDVKVFDENLTKPRRNLLKALGTLHDFVDRLMMDLLAREKGVQLDVDPNDDKKIPYSELN